MGRLLIIKGKTYARASSWGEGLWKKFTHDVGGRGLSGGDCLGPMELGYQVVGRVSRPRETHVRGGSSPFKGGSPRKRLPAPGWQETKAGKGCRLGGENH